MGKVGELLLIGGVLAEFLALELHFYSKITIPGGFFPSNIEFEPSPKTSSSVKLAGRTKFGRSSFFSGQDTDTTTGLLDINMTDDHIRQKRKAELREIFHKYATVRLKDGGCAEEMYMTTDTFMYTYLDIVNSSAANAAASTEEDEQMLSMFVNLVSKSKPGLISFSEFEAFEELCATPDAPYRILFLLMNTSRNGRLSLEEFTEFMKLTENQKEIPDLLVGSDVVKLYFGNSMPNAKSMSMKKMPHARSGLSYQEFCQFVHDFNQEFMQRIFKCHEAPAYLGHITGQAFLEIMAKYKPHLTAPLTTGFLMNSGSQLISYPVYSSVVRLLDHMPIIKLIYLKQSKGSKTKELSYEELGKGLQLGKRFNANMEISPSELEVLFAWIRANKHQDKEKVHAQGSEESPGLFTITYADLLLLSPDKTSLSRCEKMKRNQKPVSSGERSYLIQLQENGYRFCLGAMSGGFGAFMVYPIDLVKTRMQNQRLHSQLLSSSVQSGGTSSTAPELLYRNSWDCARKVVKNEGFTGLYRGLKVQLTGVAPEKALKLTVNDFMREKLSNPADCSIPLMCELVAGGVAGTTQVIITNPLEIVKIRLQTATAMATAPNSIPPPSAWTIIKELGPRGLYKGVHACMLRDSLFSAIYFTGYANLKEQFEDDDGYNSPWTLLAAGVLAGVPASSTATPADVIKTRLQVIPKPGQTVYNGIFDAARKIYREEGLPAFMKGVVPRVLRTAPQLGMTLFVYELLQRYLYIDFGGRPPKGSFRREQQLQEIEGDQIQLPTHSQPKTSLMSDQASRDRIGGYKHAPQIFQDVQTKFGFKYLQK